MLLRLVLSLFMAEGIIYDVVYYLTEPFIVPVRMIVGLFFDIERFPIDISFTLSYILLAIIEIILPNVII